MGNKEEKFAEFLYEGERMLFFSENAELKFPSYINASKPFLIYGILYKMKSLLDYYQYEYKRKLPIFYEPPSAKTIRSHYRFLREFRIDDDSDDGELQRLVLFGLSLIVNVAGFGNFGKRVLKRMDWRAFHPARFYHIPDLTSSRKDIRIFDGRYHEWNDFETVRFSLSPDLFFLIAEPGTIYDCIRKIPEIFGDDASNVLVPIFTDFSEENWQEIEHSMEVVKRMIVVNTESLISDGGSSICDRNALVSLISLSAMMIVTSLMGTPDRRISFPHFNHIFHDDSVAYAGFGETDSTKDNSPFEAFTEALQTFPFDLMVSLSGFSISIVSDRDYQGKSIAFIENWLYDQGIKDVTISSDIRDFQREGRASWF